MEVMPILALKDNYIWCLINRSEQHCIVIDPGEASPVLAALSYHRLKLSAILITHHHWDHTQGIREIVAHTKSPVYGPALEKVAGLTNPMNHGDEITFKDLGFSLKVMHVPGHTLGHIAYYNQDLLFSGDTLFTAGCGKIFEGTAEQMYNSLSAMKQLNENTMLYCGHEYTASNLAFAIEVEPKNQDIQRRTQEVSALRTKNLPTVPSRLSVEMKTNPFLRCEQKTVIEATENYANRKLNSATEVLGALREWKNHFSR